MRYAIATLCAAFLLSAIPASAQPKTATQFYTDYLAAFTKAKSIDEILPFMAKETVDQVKATPAAERAKMFQMIKMMSATNIKVTKETKTPTGYTLDVTGTDGDKKPAKGTAEIVNEGGAMKLKGESWKS